MKRTFTYASNKNDGYIVRTLLRNVGIDFNGDEVIEVEEYDNDRRAFMNLINMIGREDTVVISSIAALYDDSNESLIEKLRLLKARNVRLLIEMDSDFSYESYEQWYEQTKKIEEAVRQYRKDCHLDE